MTNGTENFSTRGKKGTVALRLSRYMRAYYAYAYKILTGSIGVGIDFRSARASSSMTA